MTTLADRLISVIPIPAAEQFYKRWLFDGRLLLFVLDKETCSYRILLHDPSTTEFSEWETRCPPKARTMPCRGFDKDGKLLWSETLYSPPSVSVSPGRERLCWLTTADEWVTCFLDRGSTGFRCDLTYPGIYNTPIWFADRPSIGLPIPSYSMKSIVGLDVYALDGEENMERDVWNMRDGVCSQTTMDNELVTVSRKGKDAHSELFDVPDCYINRLNLGLVELKGTRKKVVLPSGCVYSEVCLSACDGRLAWLFQLTETEATTYGIWFTDLQGRELEPIVVLDEEWLRQYDVPGDRDRNHVSDLEWLPDGSGVSFVYGSSVLSFAVAGPQR